MSDFVLPDWPAPESIKACATVRYPTALQAGSWSQGVFSGLNLAAHVGDRPEQVQANRALLADGLALPQSPIWLNQVHGTQVHNVLLPSRGRTGMRWSLMPPTLGRAFAR